MRAENPAALKFILQDDIYLLPADKELIKSGAIQAVTEITPQIEAETRAVPVMENPTPTPVVEIQSEPNTEATKEPIVETPVITFNYLGGYQKRFLILTHYPAHEHIDEAHLTALQSILKRRDHETTDVAIYNLAKNTITDMATLAKHFRPERVLILGKSAIAAGLESLVLNQLKPFKTFNALYSYSFDEMMDNVAYKKAFWEQMKNL